MRLLSVVYLATLTPTLLVAQPSAAQVVYGSGPSLLQVPSISAERSFQLDSSVDCPTSSLRLGAFGGAGNDWANANNSQNPYATSSSGINNYGLSASISIPFGSSLSEFCKEYAKSKSEFERLRTENFRRDAQLSLLQQCFWLKSQGFLIPNNFDLPEFSSLKVCKSKDLQLTRIGADLGPGVPTPPPESKTVPFSRPVDTIIQQRRFN
jgi:hypothetical protein